MRKRAWTIFLSLTLIGGLIPSILLFPSIQGPFSEQQDGHALAARLLPTLEPSRTSVPPTRAPTKTATPLRPLPPTRIPTRLPTTTSTPTRTPEPPPEPTLPPRAIIEGIFGYGQLLPLSCESRSAADWARHFGIEVHELEFLNHLPKSDNPEQGFVGSVYGGWGNTPPGPYGVHAEPVAKVLREEYGAQAQALKGMSFEALKYELSMNRPVMIWVTGHTVPGKGMPYEVDGQTVTVAPYEHTVIAIGYDDETDRISILDGREVYWRSYETFRDSWGALENLAVVWDK